MGAPYPAPPLDENQVFNAGDIDVLREITAENDPDQLHFDLVRQLLAVEGKYQHAARRAGLFDELNEVLEDQAFDGELEALEFAVLRFDAVEKAKEEMDYAYVQPIFLKRAVADNTAELPEEQ
jgi:DNA sulfur modification protein DndC